MTRAAAMVHLCAHCEFVTKAAAATRAKRNKIKILPSPLSSSARAVRQPLTSVIVPLKLEPLSPASANAAADCSLSFNLLLLPPLQLATTSLQPFALVFPLSSTRGRSTPACKRRVNARLHMRANAGETERCR
jgi:hypothetical protein